MSFSTPQLGDGNGCCPPLMLLKSSGLATMTDPFDNVNHCLYSTVVANLIVSIGTSLSIYPHRRECEPNTDTNLPISLRTALQQTASPYIISVRKPKLPSTVDCKDLPLHHPEKCRNMVGDLVRVFCNSIAYQKDEILHLLFANIKGIPRFIGSL